MENLVFHVFLVALGTALATGLGAVPFAFVKTLSSRMQGIAYAVAGGMMLSASVFSLAEQGLRRGRVWDVLIGFLAGAYFYWRTGKYVEKTDWTLENMSLHDSRQSVLIILTMFIVYSQHTRGHCHWCGLRHGRVQIRTPAGHCHSSP